MKDRVVQFPNRYKLTPVSGDIYNLTPEPGIVTEPGTDLNKANLLKDDTAALYGLGANAVPNEVFAVIPSLIDNVMLRDQPYEVITSSFYEGWVTANTTIVKTFAHTLGVVPRRLRLTFRMSEHIACVEVHYNGVNYDYFMYGNFGNGPLFGAWKKEWITDNYLFGRLGTYKAGMDAIEGFFLGDITMSDTLISIPLKCPSSDTRLDTINIIAEVYK